jgi:hypothetical protein
MGVYARVSELTPYVRVLLQYSGGDAETILAKGHIDFHEVHDGRLHFV